MHRIASSPASCIVRTPTPLCGLQILLTTIPNPETHAFIINPLRMGATEKKQGER